MSYTIFVKKKLLIFLITGLGFYLSFNLARGIWDSYQNTSRLIESKNNLAREKDNNQKLKEQLGLVSSPYFVEKEARDKLGLAKPGETIIVTPTPEIQKEEEKSPFEGLSIQESWWEVFFN